MKATNLRVPESLWSKVRRRAKAEHCSANTIVVRAMESYLVAGRPGTGAEDGVVREPAETYETGNTHAATLTAKGHLTIPPELRDVLGVSAGCRVELTVAGGRLVVKPAPLEPAELFGDRPTVEQVLTVEEIDQAIGRATSDRGGRAEDP